MFTGLFNNKNDSAKIAKERLKLIISRERLIKDLEVPDYLPTLQDEIVKIVSKYTGIDLPEVNINYDCQGDIETLEVKVEIS